MEFRFDRDSLGEVKIPADVYYGAFTARALKQYKITGARTHRDLVRAYVMIKRSAALANMKLKKLDTRKGNAIVRVCDEILRGSLMDQFVVDAINSGAGTAFNMNVNEVIANMALESLGRKKGDYKTLHPNDDVNMSQSSNDTFPTAMHVAVLMDLDELMPAVDKLARSLRKKARQFNNVMKVGRTHLMDALPVTLGAEFNAYAQAIENAIQAIENSKSELEQVALGGTAVGTGANAPKGYRQLAINNLAKISGLKLRLAKDMHYALQSRFGIANTSSALRNLALELIRVANDIRLMASGPVAGLSEVSIPAVHAGSSIMPGKVNPSLAESLDMVCFNVVGNDMTVALAVQAGQFELNVMLPVMIKCILDSIDMLKNTLPVFVENMVDGLQVDETKLKSQIEKNPVLVTLLVPYIGYMEAAKLYKEALKNNTSVRELVLKKRLMSRKKLDAVLGRKNLSTLDR